MSELFGAPSGFTAYADMQAKQVETLERAANIPHIQALTKQAQENTRATALKNAREIQMLEAQARLPRAGTPGAPESPSARMDQMANILSDFGFFKEAGDLFNKSNEMMHREALEMQQAATARVRLAELNLKRMDSLSNLVATAKDKDSYEAGVRQWMMENPGQPLPDGMETYDPARVAILAKSTKAGQEEARRAAQQARLDEDRAYRKAVNDRVTDHNKAQEQHWRKTEQQADQRETRIEKTTGSKAKIPTAPNHSEIQQAHSFIMRAYPDIVPDMTLGKDLMVSSAAADMASEAKALMSRNPGLSYTNAMGRVFAVMQKAGSFQTATKKGFLSDSKTTEYKPSAATPIPYVPGKTTPEDGKTYELRGELWRYDAKTKTMNPVE